MSIYTLRSCFILLLWSLSLSAVDHETEIAKIRNSLNDPSAFLKNDGSMIIMGNAPLDQANIVFLPEIHDDPKSLMTQLALIAREKIKNKSFIVVDESLASIKKSMWDVFSQKTMEILAAQDQRRDKQEYVPQQFEVALQNLATKMRSNHGQLNYLEGSGLWTLNDFNDMATPFYGWDTTQKASLVTRNVQMVNSLNSLLKNNDRILVMAGARHIPELEYMTSQKLLCASDKSSSMKTFFTNVTKLHGNLPNIKNGIGATAPIHDFLANKKYAVIFNRALYGELDRIVAQFKAHMGRQGCMRIGQ